VSEMRKMIKPKDKMNSLPNIMKLFNKVICGIIIATLFFGCKKDSNTNSQSTHITNLPLNTFSIDNYKYGHDGFTNYLHIQYLPDSNYWYLMATTNCGCGNDGAIFIYFPGKLSNIQPGLFFLQSDYNTLTSHKACVIMRNACADCIPPRTDCYYPIEGQPIQLNVTFLNSAHTLANINVIFNDINASKDSTNTTATLSANIAYSM